MSWPAPCVGQAFTDKKSVVPNLALSLQEILERFTRGEPLEIGRGEAVYDDGDEDLEKLKTMDLVDRAEYVDRMKQVDKTFQRQEKEREKRRQAEMVKLAAEKLAGDKKAADEAAEKAKLKS